MTHQEMAAELARAGWTVKAPVDPKTCAHEMRQGRGWFCADGSSEYDWWCQICGASGKSVTPKRPPQPISLADTPQN